MIYLVQIKYEVIIKKNCDYRSTWWIKLDQKNTVKNMKHLKIQYLFNNPKNTAALTSTQIIPVQIFEIQNPPKILR